MKHIKTINKANLKKTAAKGGCGKCQASCQSACKTSCTVANQTCERTHALLKGHFYVPLFLYKFVYEYKCER